MSKVSAGMTAVGLVVALAACGSTSSSSGGKVTRAGAGTSTSASAGPGVGKPPVSIGDKNFTEQYILGALYQQALQAKGFKVTLKGNIGSSEITYKALRAGQIDMYPEYTGTLLTTVAGITAPPHSAQQAYTEAAAYVKQHGFALLNPTPFYDSDALAALKTYATAHHLTTIADLKPLGKSVKPGGPPQVATRAQTLPGLKKAYGIDPTFTPLAIGLIYKALDSGQAQVSDVFTTDPELTTGKYTALTDPKKVFGFKNAPPAITQKVLKAQG